MAEKEKRPQKHKTRISNFDIIQGFDDFISGGPFTHGNMEPTPKVKRGMERMLNDFNPDSKTRTPNFMPKGPERPPKKKKKKESK